MNYKNLFSDELPIYVSEKTGLKFYYRPNTSDIKTIKEVVERNCYEKTYFKIENREHWIDLGGNIGAFTMLAIYKGATIDVYEPDEVHCDLIKKNLELNGFKANIIQKAVVIDDSKKLEDNYSSVHWGKIKDEHKEWKKEWFPPCKTVFCY